MSDQVNYVNYPLKDIPQPHPHDVLCGRGGGTNNHIGNSHWRMLVAANKQLYITLPKRQKMLLSRSIVNAVRSQNPPGRFLQKDSKTNKWFDVGDQRAQEKTSQALREGAPDIKKKTTPDGDVKSTDGSTETPGDDEPPTNPPLKKEEKKKPVTKKAVKKEDDEPIPVSIEKLDPIPEPIPLDGSDQPYPAQAQQQHHHQQQHMPQDPMTPFANGGNVMNPYMQNQQQGVHYPVQNNMPHQGMQLYPTMVLNEHGVMVPAMAALPPQAMMNHAQQQQFPQHLAPQQQQFFNPHAQHQQFYHQQQMQQQQHFQQMQQQQQQLQQMQQQQQQEEMHQQQMQQHQKQQQQQQQEMHQQQQHQQKQEIHEQQQQHKPQTANETPTFDEFIAAPPDGGLEPAGLSYGSMMLTDAEMIKLQATGASFGSVMSYRNSHSKSNDNNKDGDEHAVQAPDSLEPTGISFGDVSMMSVGTNRLSANGTSFGTMMSTMMVDGGLEAIGTSFGSLSLDQGDGPNRRDSLFHVLELAGGGPVIPPMFDSEDTATGNLLECSDTESEDSASQQQLSRKKSEAWEKMQATFSQTKLNPSYSRGTMGSRDLMPPPPGVPPKADNRNSGPTTDFTGRDLSVPTTTFDRDFSQLSTFGVEDHDDDDDDDEAAAAPPIKLEKQGSDDDEKLEMLYLQKLDASKPEK